MMRYSRLICILSAPDLESATSPRSPGLRLLEKKLLETKIWVPYVLLVVVVLLLLSPLS